MLSGPCIGVDGSGPAACVGTGWTPYWRAPAAWQTQIDALVPEDPDRVCPYCVVQRARDARVPGFNRNKADRIRALLDGLNCFAGVVEPGHVHVFDLDGETVWATHPTRPTRSDRLA